MEAEGGGGGIGVGGGEGYGLSTSLDSWPPRPSGLPVSLNTHTHSTKTFHSTQQNKQIKHLSITNIKECI